MPFMIFLLRSSCEASAEVRVIIICGDLKFLFWIVSALNGAVNENLFFIDFADWNYLESCLIAFEVIEIWTNKNDSLQGAC